MSPSMSPSMSLSLSDPLAADPGAWREVHAALMRDRRRLLRRLSPLERQALQCYVNLLPRTPGCGFALNRTLRCVTPPCPPRDNTLLLALDAVFAKATTTSAATARAVLPDGVQYLYRGLAWPAASSAAAVAAAAWRAGTVHVDPAFVSTSPLLPRALLYASRAKSDAGKSGVVLRYDVRRWRGPWVYSPNEEEVVLPRGLAWRVRTVRHDVVIDRAAGARHPRDPGVDLVEVQAAPSSVTLVDLVPP